MNNDTKALLQQIEALKAENNKLKQGKAISIAVSSKGAVSLYGIGRFPVTLYAGQWRNLMAKVADIEAFIDEAEKLGAVATSKDESFTQPSGLPLKYVAKAPSDAPKATPPATQAPASDRPTNGRNTMVTRYSGRGEAF